MPEKANQHARSTKKRKTGETLGCDSSFASIYHASSEEFQHKQGGGHLISNGHGRQEIKPPDAITAPPKQQAEGVSLNYPINNCLREHMESIMSELKEAREKLLQWMRQEIQAVSAAAGEKRESRLDAGKRKQQVDHSSNTDSVGVQTVLQGRGQSCEGGRPGKWQDPCRHEAGEPQVAGDAQEGYVHDRASYGSLQKDSGVMSVEPRSKIFDMAANSGSGMTSKTVNRLDQSLPSKPGSVVTKVGSPAQNVTSKLLTESKSALLDMCFGSGLGEDAKDVEGLHGTALESGVTIREGLEFNKGNNDMQNSLDRLDRLRETKSALLDMGFEDEESNEGNGVGCSLESAASSKVNSGFSKVTNGTQSGFSRGFDPGFVARFGGEHGEDHPGLDDRLEGAANSSDVYGSSKVKMEVVDVGTTETKHAVVSKGLVNSIRGDRLDEENRQVDSMMGANSVQASVKGSHLGGGFPPQSSNHPPGDVQQQAGISTRPACGIKRSYGTAMTFKGSALESKNDTLNVCQGNPGFADVFNSANSSIIVAKNPVQIPTADKVKVESLVLHNEGSSQGWNIFTASKNAMNHTLHDSKFAHLEYASRSKLGDAILGSGRTVDFAGFDPMFGYASHFKSGNEMIDAYQQERANTNSMYFSSVCTNNSGYLQTSNRVMGMQRPPPPSTSPSSSSALRPMLMGMPGQGMSGHVGAHHDPSNMHTFLGLGMNGVSAAANGMQVFPGLYLQSNQQHSQASFKHAPSSSSPMVSHPENSAAQEKAVLELNF